jgi:hypothetical protein
MADRSLRDQEQRELERLVQDSVFHPSPCRRLRERVLHDAGQARWRQQLKQRGLVAGLLVLIMVAVPLIAWRALSGPAPAAPVPSQQPAPASGDKPSRPSQSPGAAGGSLGAAILRGAVADER